MKTAEEWFEISVKANERNYNLGPDWIRQIQLDAMREGMKRAAEAVLPYSKTMMPIQIAMAQQDILTAAEQLTEKDL